MKLTPEDSRGFYRVVRATLMSVNAESEVDELELVTDILCNIGSNTAFGDREVITQCLEKLETCLEQRKIRAVAIQVGAHFVAEKTKL